MYGHCCNHKLPDLISDDDLERLMNELIEKIWRKKGMPKRLTEDLVRYYADELWKALTEGYGNDLTTIEYEADIVMLEKMQESIWHFSAAKNYSQLKALSEALIDVNGKLKEYADFKRDAYLINNEHKGPWLKAEYNFAVTNGQLASRWVDIQKNKELLPNLEYSSILDGHTSITCIKLDGVVRPADDLFWKVWYPPNHWGCRSDVLQNADNTVTPLNSIIYPDNIPDMFKRNLAAEGLAFPEGHPYYIDNPDGVKAAANKLMRKYGQ